jgi:O-antigen/teichoic acid export membrane protein
MALRLPTSVSNLLMPATKRASEQGTRFSTLAISSFAMASTGMMAIFLLEAPAIIEFVFGPRFSPGAPVLLLMTPRLLACAISIPMTRALYASQHAHMVAMLLAFMLPLRLILLVGLTAQWGLPGAAIAASLSDWALAVACLVAARRAQIHFPLQALLIPIGMGLLSLAAGAAAKQMGASSLIVCSLVFVFYLPLLMKMLAPLYTGRSRRLSDK